jgi:hypothetical protein
MTECARCDVDSSTFQCSWFNTDTLCDSCRAREETHPDWEYASWMESRATSRGDMNYPGVGWPGYDGRVVRESHSLQTILNMVALHPPSEHLEIMGDEGGGLSIFCSQTGRIWMEFDGYGRVLSTYLGLQHVVFADELFKKEWETHLQMLQDASFHERAMQRAARN